MPKLGPRRRGETKTQEGPSSSTGGETKTQTAAATADNIAIWSLDYDGCLAGNGAMIAICTKLEALANINGWGECAQLCRQELENLNCNGDVKCAEFVKQYIEKVLGASKTTKTKEQNIKEQIHEHILEAIYLHHGALFDENHGKIKKHHIIMIGSNRQSEFHDIANSTSQRGQHMPLSLAFFKFLNRKGHNVCLARLEDLQDKDNTSDERKNSSVAINHFPKLFPNTTMQSLAAANTAYFDESKVALLYFQMHQQATNKSGSNIFKFVDDNDNILANLHNFFKVRPDLIPIGMTLQLYRYNDNDNDKEKELEEHQTGIPGTGNRDKNYRSTLKRLFENTNRVMGTKPTIDHLPREQDDEETKWASLFLLDLSFYNNNFTIDMPLKQFVKKCKLLYKDKQLSNYEQKEQAKRVAKCIEVARYHTKEPQAEDPQAEDPFPQHAVNEISQNEELKAMYDHIITDFTKRFHRSNLKSYLIYQPTIDILNDPNASLDDKVTAMRAVKEYLRSTNNNFKYSNGLKKKIKEKQSKSWRAINIALGPLAVATVAHYHTKEPQADDPFPQDAVNAISQNKELKAMYDQIIRDFIYDHDNHNGDHPIYQHTNDILNDRTASLDDKVTAMRTVKEYDYSQAHRSFKYSKGLKKKINTKAKRSKSWLAVNIALGLLAVATVALVVLSHGLATPIAVAALKMSIPVAVTTPVVTNSASVLLAAGIHKSSQLAKHPSSKEKQEKERRNTFSSIENAI